MEAEIGVMRPQAKEGQQSPDARETEPLEGAQLYLYLDFKLLASRTVKE